MTAPRNCILIAALLLCTSSVIADEYWEEGLALPEVLTATRLKQPRSETPASVTIIDAEQIEAWGARTIPEVLRFVPGMFVGHTQKENTDSVVYHASTQNVNRRMQVLVDGRSVYKAAIARVIWDDIPVAVEDIQRIEVIRGPSSATYGANAFMATINIITKAPLDTLGTRVRYRAGNQSVDDRFLSHSQEITDGAFRITANYQKDDGLDGPDARNGKDKWDDDSRSQFVNFTLQKQLSPKVGLHLDGGLLESYAEITNTRSKHEEQLRDSQSANATVRLNFDFSAQHQSHLQMYWQKEQREHFNRSRIMAIAIDPRLAQLYQERPDDVLAITQLASSPDDFLQNQAAILNIVSRFTREQQGVFVSLGGHVTDEKVFATFDYGYNERRTDLEWQDTVIWHERLRTVSGISLRRDRAQSETFFGGERTNDSYRTFANVEWRALDSLVFNLGGSYEKDDINSEAFAPRVALNYLLAEHSSIRLIYSEAVRSPDMIEQKPGMVVKLADLSSNYLNYTEGQFYITNVSEHKRLKREKIRSYELGYYGAFAHSLIEFDIKLYHDELDNLISADPTNIDESYIGNDSKMTIQGTEAQLSLNLSANDWLWLTAAYMDIDKEIHNIRSHCVETCLSPRKSSTVSWHHKGQNWSNTFSYFWLNGFADNQHLYQRAEWQIRKQWQLGRYTPWVGGFWQHQLSHQPLGYDSQRYSTRNIFYLQTGLNF